MVIMVDILSVFESLKNKKGKYNAFFYPIFVQCNIDNCFEHTWKNSIHFLKLCFLSPPKSPIQEVVIDFCKHVCSV